MGGGLARCGLYDGMFQTLLVRTQCVVLDAFALLKMCCLIVKNGKCGGTEIQERKGKQHFFLLGKWQIIIGVIFIVM